MEKDEQGRIHLAGILGFQVDLQGKEEIPSAFPLAYHHPFLLYLARVPLVVLHHDHVDS